MVFEQTLLVNEGHLMKNVCGNIKMFVERGQSRWDLEGNPELNTVYFYKLLSKLFVNNVEIVNGSIRYSDDPKEYVHFWLKVWVDSKFVIVDPQSMINLLIYDIDSIPNVVEYLPDTRGYIGDDENEENDLKIINCDEQKQRLKLAFDCVNHTTFF